MTQPSNAKPTIWVRMRGHSMCGLIDDGQTVQVEPGRQPSRGDVVLVRKDHEGCSLRRLDSHGALVAANPDWPAVPLTDDMHIVGVATHALRRL